MSTVFVDPMTGTLPINPLAQISPSQNRIVNSPRRVQSMISPPQGFFTVTQQSLDTSLNNSRIYVAGQQSQGSQPKTDSRIDSLKLCIPLTIVFLLFYWGFVNTFDNTISNVVTNPPIDRIKQIETCQGFLFGVQLCKLICVVAILCQVLIVVKTIKDYYQSEQTNNSPFDWIKLYRKVALASLIGILVTITLTEFAYLFGHCHSGEHIYFGTIFFCIVVIGVLLLHIINQRKQSNK